MDGPKTSSPKHLPMSVLADADEVNWVSSSLGDATRVYVLSFYRVVNG